MSAATPRRESLSRGDLQDNKAAPALSLTPSAIHNDAHNVEWEPKSVSTASERRGSFSLSEEQDTEAIAELKKTVSNEVERRQSIPTIPEDAVPEQALYSDTVTPIAEVPESSGVDEESTRDASVEMPGDRNYEVKGVNLPMENTQSQDSEKIISTLENGEETLQPVDVNGTVVAAGGQSVAGSVEANLDKALSTDGQEDDCAHANVLAQNNGGRNSDKAVVTTFPFNHKKISQRHSLATSAFTTSPKPSSSRASATALSSPNATNSYKSRPHSVKSQPARAASSKISRSPASMQNNFEARKQPASLSAHLTAPIASSSAKHDSASKPSKAPSVRSRKLIQSSSHFLAPTAASAAKQDIEGVRAPSQNISNASSKPIPGAKQDRVSIGPGPTTVARKPSSNNARSSLQLRNGTATKPPGSRIASASSTTQPSGEGFLARLTRPTAASSGKLHEKTDVKHAPPAAADRPAKAGSVRGTRNRHAVGTLKRTIATSSQKDDSRTVRTRALTDEMIHKTAPPLVNGETRDSEALASTPPQSISQARDEEPRAKAEDSTAGLEFRGMETPELEEDVIR